MGTGICGKRGVMMTRQGAQCPEGYLPRIADAKVERYLGVFGAVEIAGTKWCGKTWTALAHGESVSFVDTMLELAKDDPSALLLGDRPHVIDEWQRVPAIWDAVRHAVDRTRGLRGGWLLTGSSTPFVRDGQEEGDIPSHSGAGRIGRVRLRPMTLAESGDSSCGVSLAGLFEGEFEPAQVRTDAETIVRLAVRGGWPEAIDLPARDAQLVAREYLRALRDESVPRHGKDGDLALRIVFSIARSLGQAATYRTMIEDARDASAEIGSLSDQTLRSYLALLRALYLLEEIPGWVPASRSRKRVASKPKRYLADPSLAAAVLGMSEDALMKDWQTFGLLFENMCMRDLLVYADALPDAGFVPVRYYRDTNGLEADAIIELADGRWAAIEIKTSERKVPEAVANLKRLRERLCESAAARVRPPEFMAVVTGVSEFARQVEKDIYVVPITALSA